MRAAAAVSLLAAAVALPACHRNRAARTVAVRTEAASPAVRGADSGLEMWWWVVPDPWAVPPDPEAQPAAPPEPPSKPSKSRRGRAAPPVAPPPRPHAVRTGKLELEKVLAPYLDRPIPLSPQELDRWKASGLRLVAVPVADLDKIQSAIPLVGQVQRQWLGELSAWTDIIDGPTQADSSSLSVDDGVVHLEPGRLRLLARCWTVPVPGESGDPMPAFRLELVPQHEPTRTEQQRLLAAAGLGTPSDAEGTIFRTLAVGITTTQPDAYLIVPDRPVADWRAAPAAAATDEPGPTGPRAEPPRTLGEAMLSSSATVRSPRTRAVIVLIPRLPSSYELMGR